MPSGPGDGKRPARTHSPLGTISRKRGLGLLACLVGLVLVVLMSLAFGARETALGDVLGALFDFDGSTNHLVVRELRIPRTALGVVVGAALGVAGTLMQAITRNPLADPGLLGVSAGGALMVVVGITFFGLSSTTGYVWFAFVGAAVVSVVVYALGSLGRGGATPVRLTLAGAAAAALLASFTSALVLLNQETLDQFRFWAVGSLAGRPIDVFADMTPFIAVGVALAVVVAGPLNALGLGEETARALGVKVGVAKLVTVTAITLLCGAAVAACGPIGFLGLVIPHAGRRICGPDHRWLLPYSAVLGAVVLLVCDVVSRIVVRPGELQVGITMAALGGVVFIVLVRGTRLAQL